MPLKLLPFLTVFGAKVLFVISLVGHFDAAGRKVGHDAVRRAHDIHTAPVAGRVASQAGCKSRDLVGPARGSNQAFYCPRGEGRGRRVGGGVLVKACNQRVNREGLAVQSQGFRCIKKAEHHVQC